MKVGITIAGIADVNRILGEIGPREGRKIMRATVLDIARRAAVEAKGNMPVDSGDMIRATRHKARRGRPDRLEADVIVGGKTFYWKFLEYGDGPDGVEHAMFLRALQAMRPNMSRIYVESFAKKLIARLVRERKRLG